jgi:hypothetical protein
LLVTESKEDSSGGGKAGSISFISMYIIIHADIKAHSFIGKFVRGA